MENIVCVCVCVCVCSLQKPWCSTRLSPVCVCVCLCVCVCICVHGAYRNLGAPQGLALCVCVCVRVCMSLAETWVLHQA